MSIWLNRAKMTCPTAGNGTVTLVGAVAPHISWGQAGAVNGRRYQYLIEEGVKWELGNGVYNNGTLTRTLLQSSTGALLDLSGLATVACVMQAAEQVQVIEKKRFTGVETSFAFTAIPQEFSRLELEIFGRLGTVSAGQVFAFTVNGNATGIYDMQRYYKTGNPNPTLLSGADSNLAQPSWNSMIVMPATGLPLQTAGAIIDIQGYAQALLHKAVRARSLKYPNASFDQYVLKTNGGIRLTAAITSIECLAPGGGGTWEIGSYAVLRGIP